jgi:alkylhydroperoxidase family enzyme
LTDGPRLPPIPPTEWPEEMREALAALQPPNPRHPLPARDPDRPKGHNALGMFAHHPALTKAYNTFNGHILFATTLTARQRELLVLRVATRRRCEYEWLQHVLIGRDAGLDDADIERVVQGPDADGWDDLDRALLAAADELLSEARVHHLTWATLARHLDPQQLLDVVFTVGAYDVVAMAFNTFDVAPDDDLRAAQERKRASP